MRTFRPARASTGGLADAEVSQTVLLHRRFNAWFVQVGGKQVNLGPDREAALRRYHELMRQPKVFRSPAAAENVLSLLDAFLDWRQKHKAGRTYDWYRAYLESFAREFRRD